MQPLQKIQNENKKAQAPFLYRKSGTAIILLDWRHSTIDVLHIPPFSEEGMKKTNYTAIFQYIDTASNLMNSLKRDMV